MLDPDYLAIPPVRPRDVESTFDVDYQSRGGFTVQATHEWTYDVGIIERAFDITTGDIPDNVGIVVGGGETVKVQHQYEYRPSSGSRSTRDGHLTGYDVLVRPKQGNACLPDEDGSEMREELPVESGVVSTKEIESYETDDGVGYETEWYYPPYRGVERTPLQFAQSHHFGDRELGFPGPVEQLLSELRTRNPNAELLANYLDSSVETTTGTQPAVGD